jgi:hypothetical protein
VFQAYRINNHDDEDERQEELVSRTDQRARETRRYQAGKYTSGKDSLRISTNMRTTYFDARDNQPRQNFEITKKKLSVFPVRMGPQPIGRLTLSLAARSHAMRP